MGRDSSGRFVKGDGIDIPIDTPGAAEAAVTLGRVGGSVEGLAATVTRAAATFNQLHASLSTAVDMTMRAATAVSNLSAEQQHLNDMSRRLGLDFDAASAAAGRFTDETTAMGAAGQFAARGINLSQTQLNALERVAANTAQTLGITTAEATERLTQGLIRGRERGLAPFGAEIAATARHGYTMSEGLAALVHEAEHVATATDDARTSMERFRDTMDDAQRTAAGAFVDELMHIEHLKDGFDGAKTSAADFTNEVRSMGQTLAAVVEFSIGLVQVLAGGLAVSAGGIAQLMHVIATDGTSGDISGFIRDAVSTTQEGAHRIQALRASLAERTSATPEADPHTAITRVNGVTRVGGVIGNAGAPGTEVAGLENTSDEDEGGAGGHHRRTRANRAQSLAGAEAMIRQLETDLAARNNARADHAAGLDLSDAPERAAAAAALDRAHREAADRTQLDVQRRAREADEAQRHAQSELTGATANAAEGAEGGHSAAAQRAELIRVETDATQRLAHAKRELAAAQAEVHRGQVATLEQQAHITAATREVAQATSAQTAAHRAAAAEMERVAAGPANNLQSAAEGLAGGLIKSGMAAAFAGENIGKAFAKELEGRLESTAEEALVLALFETAHGIAALASIGGAALAPGHFTAAAQYAATAAAAGVGAVVAHAVGGSGASAPASAPASSGDQRAGSVSPRSGRSANDSSAPIVIQYFAPVINGRAGTDADVGTRLARFDDAARSRLPMVGS